MYSRLQHEEHINPEHFLDNCIIKSLSNGDTLYDSKEIKMMIKEKNISFPGGDGDSDLPYISEIIILDMDKWFLSGSLPISIINTITELISHPDSDKIKRIIIVGGYNAMSVFKVVNNECKKDEKFSAWVSGINVLRAIRQRPDNPLVVACITSREKSSLLDITRTYYV